MSGKRPTRKRCIGGSTVNLYKLLCSITRTLLNFINFRCGPMFRPLFSHPEAVVRLRLFYTPPLVIKGEVIEIRALSLEQIATRLQEMPHPN